MSKTAVTPGLVRAALAAIPANLPHDEWVRIAMAVKSEFPGDEGLALFDEWSATAIDSYNPKNVRTAWQSINAGGPVKIGSLLREAKTHGFVPASSATAPAAHPEAFLADARKASERVRKREADQAKREAKKNDAAAHAVALWEQASEAPHAYLARKGVHSHGLRVAPDGWLLVPLRNASGTLRNVQRIAADKRADGPDKFYLPGGQKSGLWHELGTLTGADAILIAEGYATAASVHEATERPAVVAFDVGNLLHVAKALRAQHPTALLMLCGDDDQATQAARGHNPGRDKATAAAAAVAGAVAFPAPLPDGGSDFNDLSANAGPEAVRELIEAAIHEHRVAAAKPAARARHRANTDAAGDLAGDFDVFSVDDSGVWFVGVEQDGKRRPPEWVCSRLDVAALTRDQDGTGWGYLLQFADPLGHAKHWAMPSRMLSGDGGEYRAALLNMGLRIATGPRARNLLSQYIQTRAPAEFATCTDRTGWHGYAYVLPRESIGDDAERIVFQSESQMENTFTTKGTAAQWRERVGELCAGNSRLVFAVSAAFAGPLLRPAAEGSGGFHLRGDSSCGKTTALRVAASVNGGGNYLQRWRTTDNALEAIAAQHCDATLILDELAQVDPKTAGECAYMLANEQSKARSTRSGAPRSRLAWRLLFLSAGEIGLADHMAEGMKRARTGQEVRMADVPADAGAGLGIFEDLHGFVGGAAFANHLNRAVLACYGAPGFNFIEWACAQADTLAKRVRADVAALAARIVPPASSGQVERVGARFALVGVAGELATEAGLTGWAKGEAERATKACFDAWLAARGGRGNGEVTAILRQVKHFVEVHGAARFPYWHRAGDDHAPNPLQRAGLRRMLDSDGKPIKTNSQHGAEFGDRMASAAGEGSSAEYFVLPEVFRSEVCRGFDVATVCRVLINAGCLVCEDGHYTVSQRLPGIGKVRCYHLTTRLMELDV